MVSTDYLTCEEKGLSENYEPKTGTVATAAHSIFNHFDLLGVRGTTTGVKINFTVAARGIRLGGHKRV